MNLPPNSATARLPPRERTLLQGFSTAVTPAELARLSQGVGEHLATAAAALAKNELLDVGLARRIASVLQHLLESYANLGSTDAKALAVGATRFFLERADAEHDLASALGFDDDARVLNAVLHDIGRPDLKVTF